ncbi:class IV adenylate cyclase [Candidatus Pacearchaeota archaeon]|nr:class IV adenylate cyclase [Candidatus Pacearchaeota archaeon]
MVIENEVKIRLDEAEFVKVIDLLGKSQFHTQTNSFFKVKKGFLRLREENNKLFLTFKGKKIESEFKACEETELELSKESKSTILRLLENLGLKFLFQYTKQRASYYFSDCVVCLDILENGKKYIEIEGNNESIKEKINSLNLNLKNIEEKSYFKMHRGKND